MPRSTAMLRAAVAASWVIALLKVQTAKVEAVRETFAC